MNSSGLQRLIPIALVIIIIVIAVAALVSVGRSILGGGGSTPTIVDTSKEALLNTALDRSVSITVRGPIVADEKFHSYVISVTPTSRTLTTYEGYLDRQVDVTTLANNTKGYEEFVHALDRAGMVTGDQLQGDADDTRGICATGRVYEFEVLQASNIVKRLWTTTCGKSKGSLKVQSDSLINLFQKQIPNATAITSKVNL